MHTITSVIPLRKTNLAFHSYSFYLFMMIGTACLFPVSILSFVPVQVPIKMFLPLLYGLYVVVYRPYQAGRFFGSMNFLEDVC
jgi:hypothetical protein